MAEVIIYVIETRRTNNIECLLCRYSMALGERRNGLILLTVVCRAHIRDAESGVIVHTCPKS